MIYAGSHADPPDIEMVNRKSRRRRFYMAFKSMLVEMVLTVVVHPMPGYKRTSTVMALSRAAKYEFEAIIGQATQCPSPCTVLAVPSLSRAAGLAGKLWACQAIISFSTLLLGVAVVFRCNISLQVPPRTLMLPGLESSVASVLPLPGGRAVECIRDGRLRHPLRQQARARKSGERCGASLMVSAK